MAVDDVIITNIAKFNKKSQTELKDRRRDYERAKFALKNIPEYKKRLEEKLKIKAGHNLATPMPATMELSKEGITFYVNSIAKTKRPAYSKAVEQMENYPIGISKLLSEKRDVSRIIPVKNKAYISADELLEQYNVIVGGLMVSQIQQKIKYDLAPGKLESLIIPPRLELKNESYEFKGSLNEKEFELYVLMDKLEPSLEAFVTDYEKKLPKAQGKSKAKKTQVTKMQGYEHSKSLGKGADWKFVVSALVQIYDDDPEGELNILANPHISFKDKKIVCPDYDLMQIAQDNIEKTHVSLQSVYDRIQILKIMNPLEYKREKYSSIEIV